MIGIVFLLNIEYAPFLNKYTAELEKNGQKFEVISWKRLDSKYTIPWKHITYEKRSNLGDSKFKKGIDFYGFRRFLINILREKKYEKLIILTTLSGMLIWDYLLKNYKGKFILDIRDYTFENFKPFKFIESKLIDSSYFTAISSPGYKNFLPKSSKFIISHNIILDELKSSKLQTLNDSDRINIVFLGAVRHFEIKKEIVNLFGNDNRFNIYFHGNGVAYERLLHYCNDKFDNVFLTGKYDRIDKAKLIENATIINSYYGSENYANMYALSNKYYDSLIYKKPLWANPKLYIGKRAIDRGIGIDLELNNDAPNRLIGLLNNFNWEDFYDDCDKELKKVLDEDKLFVDKLNDFIKL